ncbi:MAG: adenylosuccinate lyase [Flavobacteriales bacterium]|nr:MAG: adenylosuccinate lyase [Flavobacteriales bacterium]
MDPVDFNRLLCEVDHSRQKRTQLTTLVIKNPNLLALLFTKAFEVNDPMSSRTCWVLEFMAKDRLEYLLPYLDDFIPKLAQFHLDSSVRPMAKICECLTHSYFSKTKNKTQKVLNSRHLGAIATVCFDWLITPQKVAAQAYAMTCLCLLGQEITWIHPELKLILEQGYHLGSHAYKARARVILTKLAKENSKVL